MHEEHCALVVSCAAAIIQNPPGPVADVGEQSPHSGEAEVGLLSHEPTWGAAPCAPEPKKAKLVALLVGATLLAGAAVHVVGSGELGRQRSGEDMGSIVVPKMRVQAKDAVGYAVATVGACAAAGEDCSASACCQQEGFQCFRKDETWAACKSTCTEEGWNCGPIGGRAAATVSAEGAGPGEICAVVQKCKQEGYQCFQQNDYYSACKVTCSSDGWTCNPYGERTPMKNTTDCAWGADVCAPLGCCVAEGLQCYERDEYWSSCMTHCEDSMDFGTGPETWSCKAVGERRAVELGCTWMNEECSATKLCCHEGMSCMKKDDRVAYCKHTLEPGWDGTVLGGARGEWQVPPAGAADSTTGTTLFCLMAVLPGSAEEGLMQTAKSKGASIFGCDANGVFNSWQSASGSSMDLGAFGQAWNSVVNTDVFVNVYEQVLKDGRYAQYDWTVKVDPDSVFFPDRLRYHLAELHPPSYMPIYIKNTDKDFGFLGACEVFSKDAIAKYARYYKECFRTISAQSGEDGYMKGCMDMIGAGFMVSLDVLRTPHHDGPCSDAGRVTFHPFKDVGAWDRCYQEAQR